MPEYLAPAVYVEETQSGSKPIEGVGTSTAGFVGVTERGPLDAPQLVTSFGEYRRLFGGTLPAGDFTDLSGRAHCYLPHAVEGFFVNGGKRAYVTRVLPGTFDFARRSLFFADPAVTVGGASVLLRAAQVGTGTAVNAPPLMALAPTNFAVNDWVRIGDGSNAEYRRVAGLGGAQRHIALNFPLYAPHANATAVTAFAPAELFAPVADAQFALVDDVPAQSTTLLVKNGSSAKLLAALPPAAAAGTTVLVEIGATGVAEYAFATRATAAPTAGQVIVTLARPLRRAYAANAALRALATTPTTSTQLSSPAAGGDSVVYLDTVSGAFTAVANIITINLGGADQEAHGIGELSTLPLSAPTYLDYPAGTRGEHVGATVDNRAFVSFPGAGKFVVKIDSVAGLAPGMTLTFTVGMTVSDHIVDAVDTANSTITLRTALTGNPTAAIVVPPKRVTADAPAGSISLALDDRLGLAVGDIVQIGTIEIATVREVSGVRGAPPDAGAIVLTQPLRTAVAKTTPIRRLVVVPDLTRQLVFLPLAAPAGTAALLVNDGTGYAAGDVLRLTLPDGTSVLHRLSGAAATAAPREIELDTALDYGHDAGSALVERETLFELRALDPGAWGDRLWVSCREEAQGLASGAEIVNANPAPGPGLFSSLQVSTTTGIEPGTILEVLTPDGGASGLPLLKVRDVNRSLRICTLDLPGLTVAHMNAFTAAQMAGLRLRLKSREFGLDVLLRQRPDPAVPSRNDNVIDGESFRQLSMDPRHSRYIERVLGTTFTIGADVDDAGVPLRRWDRRSEGASNFVRARDLAAPANREAIRPGPEALADTMPSGLVRAARHAFAGGNDRASLMGDAMYLGADSNEPADRTGIYTFKNLQTIALVAAPGQTSPVVQQALIDHCELMRYRFAVIDGPAPASDTVADVQNHRQLFDTKYAAIYHPWVTIPDPFPASLSNIRQYPIPPSGHVLGVYARVDNERGVHKAPANETVRGIAGLTRYFTQGEQDILNPYPVHVNVIRDFRPNNRGIRVWGARCITSESDYKYVNVRRLLIFLEDSIDRGLQWVVFEPNAEPLWARVRRSIVNFLTTVWRNGALEGTSPEQAFFVKCDRTTMTRDDLDNGRLVCVIGVAPVKPAEFVIVRIGLWTADAES